MRWLPALCCILLVASPLSAADLTGPEVRVVAAIRATVAKAGASYAGGDYQAAGERIGEAIKQVKEAVAKGSPELYDSLLPTMKRIEKAHTMLEFEGVSVVPFERPPRPVPMVDKPLAPDVPKSPSADPDPSKTTPSKTTPPKPTPTPASETSVSFTSSVAPILVSRCGRCHVGDSKGGFSAASYAALMKGPPEGVVVFAGDTIASRLIEVIETGDMPRGNGKVAPAELQMLKSWILAGAKFDGTDPDSPLSPSRTPASPTINMNLEVRRATGNETVSFAADVAPLLVDNCNGCHIDARQTRGGLRMDTFAQFLRGGDNGAIVEPGKGSESLLVQKLRGMVGQQMPAGGRPALSEESIELISTWIDEGATLDGASATQPLRVMSQLAWAASATPKQLSERRQELAERNLKLVTASADKVASHQSDHFFIIGPVSSGTLELVAQLAEDQIRTVKSVVKRDGGETLYRGKATIFVFPKRYDYSEFAKMVESRSIPADWNSHWSFDGIDAYVSVVASERDEEEAIESRLASPLVSLAVATRGRDVPRWFAEGLGLATANRTAGSRDRDARRKQEAAISRALASMQNAKQFLDGKLGPEETDRIGGAIAATMLGNQRRNLDALLRGLGEGKPFELSFRESFRATPQEFVEAWIRWVRGS